MRTILAFARAMVSSNLSYRGAIVVWMVVSMIRLGVALFIWLAAGNQILGGYTKPEIIGYYVIILFFDWTLMWNPFNPIVSEIKSGQIMAYLLRPVSYVRSWLGKEAGFKLVSLSILSVIAIAIFFILSWIGLLPILHPNWGWLALSFAVPGAVAVSFLITMCMALLAFWFTEVRYVNYVYWTFMPLLGGLFLPTSFLPPVVERINWFLPFRYHLSLVMEIVLNRLNSVETLESLGLMGLWIAIFYRLYKFMWREGVKNYSAFGQ